MFLKWLLFNVCSYLVLVFSRRHVVVTQADVLCQVTFTVTSESSHEKNVVRKMLIIKYSLKTDFCPAKCDK